MGAPTNNSIFVPLISVRLTEGAKFLSLNDIFGEPIVYEISLFDKSLFILVLSACFGLHYLLSWLLRSSYQNKCHFLSFLVIFGHFWSFLVIFWSFLVIFGHFIFFNVILGQTVQFWSPWSITRCGIRKS